MLIMSATLGGLLKDYRMQKGISQLEVAVAMGWKDGSILSRIEQGATNKPSREAIDNLSIILGLTTSEKNQILYSGNYLPTKDEIIQIRRETDSVLKNWKYPATVYDTSWRIIHENEICKYIYYETDKEAKEVEENTPNIFEINFGEEYSQYQLGTRVPEDGLEEELKQSIIQYKADQKSNQADENINSLIKKLINNKRFREVWEQTQNNETKNIINNYTYADYVIPARGPKENLTFHLFNTPLLEDPRINIEFHTPADKKTFEYFEKHSFDS